MTRLDLRELLERVSLFGPVDQALATALESVAEIRAIARGETLVREAEPSDTLFVVLAGRFETHIAGRRAPVAEIGLGELVGEIGFFSGEARTATVIAMRDATVLSLPRAGFERVAALRPEILRNALSAVSRRLAATTRRLGPRPLQTRPRTIALVPCADRPLPQQFLDRLGAACARAQTWLLVTEAELTARFGNAGDAPGLLDWLHECERAHRLVLFALGPAPGALARRMLNQSDEIVLVASGDAAPPGPLEILAMGRFPTERRRFARLHPTRVEVKGTTEWLVGRDVKLVQHLALDTDDDIASLCRVLSGRANGFVAAGGGAFGPAHVGVLRAFTEAGIVFDVFGGTSFGAGTAASFAFGMTPEEFSAGLDDLFVHSRAFSRRSIPRYALLDHRAFDAGLRRLYRDWSMPDAWRPVFAIAADLSENRQTIIDRGPVWFAVRASSAIPAILPPAITASGRLLVDGGIVDNVPLAPMKALKTGPNLVVHFGLPKSQRYTARYEDIPGRGRLLRHLLMPGGRRLLPDIPGPAAIIERAMTFQQPAAEAFGPEDLVLELPQFPGSSLLDFSRHRQVTEAAYLWARTEIARLEAEDDPALRALAAAGRG